jgi:hypothetical protein
MDGHHVRLRLLVCNANATQEGPLGGALIAQPPRSFQEAALKLEECLRRFDAFLSAVINYIYTFTYPVRVFIF